MAKLSRSARNVLSARKVQTLAKPGRYADGGNLYLQVTKSGTKSWIFRYWRSEKDVWMGLGPYPDISLADARLSADDHRVELRKKEDPITERQKRADEKERARRADEAAQAKQKTFSQCRETFISVNSAEWSNPKHKAQWENTLKNEVEPFIGKLPVAEIETTDIVSVLLPIWTKKTETATRIRQRIERVLDWAKAMGYREGDNPAAWKGNLDAALPKPNRIKKTSNFAAMPYEDVGEFVQRLRASEGFSIRALELCILTAMRTGEIIGAQWSEINGDVWTIPAGRMKARETHRVPLSAAAMECIGRLPKVGVSLFPGQRRQPHMSNMAMLQLLRGMIEEKYTVHGFRSSFRDWAAETTNTPNEVVEMALAHTIKNKVEAAYRRGDLLDKRQALMSDWAQYLIGSQETRVVELND